MSNADILPYIIFILTFVQKEQQTSSYVIQKKRKQYYVKRGLKNVSWHLLQKNNNKNLFLPKLIYVRIAHVITQKMKLNTYEKICAEEVDKNDNRLGIAENDRIWFLRTFR